MLGAQLPHTAPCRAVLAFLLLALALKHVPLVHGLSIYVYELPKDLQDRAAGPPGFGDMLTLRVLASPYRSLNGDTADFYSMNFAFHAR